MMPQPTDDLTNRTGEMPRIPCEADLRVEAEPPLLPVPPLDVRSETGVHRFFAEACADAPRDVDRPTLQKDSHA